MRLASCSDYYPQFNSILKPRNSTIHLSTRTQIPIHSSTVLCIHILPYVLLTALKQKLFPAAPFQPTIKSFASVSKIPYQYSLQKFTPFSSVYPKSQPLSLLSLTSLTDIQNLYTHPVNSSTFPTPTE